ncbi:MAG TPA: nucleoside monophosphate kinase [Bryobacteraceae bacterium]
MRSGDIFVGILLGAPGSGKGTQGATLSELYRIPTISTGDLLRIEIASLSPLGWHVKSVIAGGQLVGDELVNDMVSNRISQADCARGFLLDGYPRSRPQAQFLDSLLEERQLPEPAVIHLDVPLEQLKTRMLARRQCPGCKRTLSVLAGGEFRAKIAKGLCPYDDSRLVTRPDDRVEAVESRLAGYENYEREVVAHYQARNYHRINGNTSMHEVTAQVLEALTAVVVVAAQLC